jgi:enamine deaminase RidA (YjgF/YER057c/UK114 family)
MVWVNTWLLRDLRTPFGGVKQSGVGREGGAHSLHFFTQEKNITLSYDPRLAIQATSHFSYWLLHALCDLRIIACSPDSTSFPTPLPLPGHGKATLATSTVRHYHASRTAQDGTCSSAKPSRTDSSIFHVKEAPKPVGAYAHAREVPAGSNLLFVSGTGPRQSHTNEVGPVLQISLDEGSLCTDGQIPGGPTRDHLTHAPLKYDVQAQTRAVIENVRCILEACGSSLEEVCFARTVMGCASVHAGC